MSKNGIPISHSTFPLKIIQSTAMRDIIMPQKPYPHSTQHVYRTHDEQNTNYHLMVANTRNNGA
jgi:hypothetical protein